VSAVDRVAADVFELAELADDPVPADEVPVAWASINPLDINTVLARIMYLRM
jgi:hypothetical protein